MTSMALKQSMTGEFHHAANSTTNLLRQIIETVAKLGDIETTLRESLEQTELMVRQASVEKLELRRCYTTLQHSMSDLSDSTEIPSGWMSPGESTLAVQSKGSEAGCAHYAVLASWFICLWQGVQSRQLQ